MIDLSERLQQLRKQKGLTQEELASSLYVSRAAVSKWESGRGYPSIDSLKAISAFYGVSIDELLSADEALTLGKEDQQRQKQRRIDLTFGLLDCCVVLLLFFPLFRQQEGGVLRAVSLLSLSGAAPYMKAAYLAVIVSICAIGALILAPQRCLPAALVRMRRTVSLALHALGVFLLILGMHPYAAAFLLVSLAVKAFFAFRQP